MSCEARRKERFANAARGELRMQNETSTEALRVIGQIGPIAKASTILNPGRSVTRQTSLTCIPLAGAARRHSDALASSRQRNGQTPLERRRPCAL